MSDTPETHNSQSPEDASATNAAASSPDISAGEQPQAGQADTIPSLEDLLKVAELKAAEHHDAWLRAKAEGENIRRRAQEDITKASKFAVEKFAAALLPVKDSLEAALSNENQSAEALKSGVEITLKQLVSAFEKSNLAEIAPVGEKFDPHKHQAISQIDAPEGTEPNTVLTVLQKGYALHDRVVRPALVVVAKAKT